MKTRLSILLLMVAFLMPLSTQAQVGNFIKKKVDRALNTAGHKADQEVNNEVDKAAESAVTGTKNAILESVKKQDGDSTATQPQEGEKQTGATQTAGKSGQKKPGFGGLGFGKVTAKYDDNYDFKGLIRMKTEMYEKGKPEGTVDIDMWFNTNTNSIGMETSTMTSDEGDAVKATAIVDMKNMVMITVADVNGSKSGMIMVLPDSVANDAGTVEPEANVTVRKKGGSRVICGYRCDEYEVIEEGGKTTSNVWVTEDLKLKGNSKLLGNQQGMPRAYGKIKGAMLASETYEKGTIVSKMEVTKIDMDASHSISVAGASLMQMDMSKWGQKKK